MDLTQAFIRVDANREIGTGHLFRCLLLARKLQAQKIPSTFLVSNTHPLLLRKLEEEGFRVKVLYGQEGMDPDDILGQINARGGRNPLLVIDSSLPNFYTSDFQQRIRRHNVRLMMITFHNNCHFTADIVHNQSLLALQQSYSTEPYTKLLIGPRYTILDDAFYRVARKIKKRVRSVRTLFLSFGGTDSSNLTVKTLKALLAMKDPPRRIIVVVGILYNSLDELKALISKNTWLDIALHMNASEMPSLMAQSDLAITSGGLTVWELACLGIPNIIISTSERERQHSLILEQVGQCLYLGHKDCVSHEQIAQAITGLMNDESWRHSMSQKSRKLVDGRGLERVLKHMVGVLEGG